MKMVSPIGLNIKKNKLRVGIMSDFYSTLMAMKQFEERIKNHIDPDVREYVKAVDATMLDMQAYIDYLLIDDELNEDDVKP
jgi:hypothetical protein